MGCIFEFNCCAMRGHLNNLFEKAEGLTKTIMIFEYVLLFKMGKAFFTKEFFCISLLKYRTLNDQNPLSKHNGFQNIIDRFVSQTGNSRYNTGTAQDLPFQEI